MKIKILLLLVSFIGTISIHTSSFGSAHADPAPTHRVLSMYVAQDFINEQIVAHQKSTTVEGMKVELDPDQDRIFVRGLLHVPVEELRAINLDPKLGAFRFQVGIKISTTPHGHLVLEFPLNETFFYSASSTNPKQDRVVIPVQMLSLALASARGYLAALSGDFKGFDRRTDKLEALMRSLDRSIAVEKNADAKEDLKTQREALRLQLAAVPVERKQLKTMSKEFETMLGFTGENEINLNDDLAARKNSLLIKIKLSQLIPYLDGVDLGGVRIVHDKKDGAGQNYFVIDVNAKLEVPEPPKNRTPSDHPAMKVPPSLVVRLNQALFESDLVVSEEKKNMGKLKEFNIEFKDDGMHVSGKWRTLLILSIPFDTVVDFVSTGPDVFEARVRKIDLAGIDVDFLGKFVLESIKKRLNQSLKGLCHFKYVGEESDHSRALQVTVDSKSLVPAFPDLHLVDVDVRDREFLLKIGKVAH